MNGADEGIVARPRACVQHHNDGQEEKRAQGKGHSPEASGRYGGGCGRRCGRRPGRSRASLRGLLPVSPPTDFSSKQWKKVSTRRCLECIEQGHCAARTRRPTRMDVTRTGGVATEHLCRHGRGRCGADSTLNGSMGRGCAREHQGGGWEAIRAFWAFGARTNLFLLF